MDTDTLRWFQLVADGVTVTEVSEIEGVSQPGVSRALARLESQLGTPLLRRSGRTLRMTHAGSAFKRHVDGLLHQLDDGLAAVDQIIDPERGTVALAFSASLGAWLVPDVISTFRSVRPEVGFTLARASDDRVSTLLAKGRADLVLSTVRPEEQAVHWQRLMDQPLRLVVPVSHPLARHPELRLADAAAEPFVMLQRRSQLRQLCEELCRAAGFEPAVALRGDDLPNVAGLVAAGLGVALMPAGPASARSSQLRYLRITDVQATREIGVSWARERRLLPAAEVFRDHVLERARAQRLPGLAD
ncbi:MAG TPA: LysR family transcriptional regulator [Propionibacteriaceae bacterium]|nr:LysR family transcriptional regulator [Propionibacteriaceae bacterium]